MLDNFGKNPVAISLSAFFIALLAAVLYAVSFDQSIVSASESNRVYVLVSECDVGMVTNQSQHDVRINRKHFTYRYELPRKKF